MIVRGWRGAGFQLRLMYGAIAVGAVVLTGLAVAMLLLRPVFEPAVRWVHPAISILFLHGRGAWRYETGFYWIYTAFIAFFGLMFGWLSVMARLSSRRVDRQVDAYVKGRMAPRDARER